ncbi:MAG: hypothetical protein JKP90_20505 [Desulfofustis sp. PB-SRB1]|nr:hypothetical protein [Desulfofustis sp. PB-SRB1]
MGIRKTVGSDGKLVDYGILSSGLGTHSTGFTQQWLLRFELSMNEEINCLVHIHMTKRAEQKNKWLTKNERDLLVPKAKDALDILASVVEQNK